MTEVHVPQDDTAGWTLVLEPRRPWLDLRPGELWHARDLIMLFVRRDFVASYFAAEDLPVLRRAVEEVASSIRALVAACPGDSEP